MIKKTLRSTGNWWAEAGNQNLVLDFGEMPDPTFADLSEIESVLF